MKQPNDSWRGGTRLRLSFVGSAAHPPWMVPKGMGGEGGNKRSGRKSDQGNAERGGNRRKNSIRETAVDESRKEMMAGRVARYQAD